MREITLQSVTGAITPADYTHIEKMRVGGVAMHNTPVAFADAHPFKRFGLAKKPSMLLGMDMLRLFRRVSIDFANRRIRFLLPETQLIKTLASGPEHVAVQTVR